MRRKVQIFVADVFFCLVFLNIISVHADKSNNNNNKISSSINNLLMSLEHFCTFADNISVV